MFTGLVQMLGTVTDVQTDGPGRRLTVRAAAIAAEASVGDSIAVNGCCLTAIDVDKDTVSFEAGPETLSRTNLGALVAGSSVNLERSLRAGDPLGGHFVTGHIDAVGSLDSRDDAGDWSTMWFRVPAALTRQMVSKGSVAVDGVSLTLVDVESDRFSVQLIPHTLAVTTLGKLPIHGAVNVETDLLAKYAQKAIDG